MRPCLSKVMQTPHAFWRAVTQRGLHSAFPSPSFLLSRRALSRGHQDNNRGRLLDFPCRESSLFLLFSLSPLISLSERVSCVVCVVRVYVCLCVFVHVVCVVVVWVSFLVYPHVVLVGVLIFRSKLCNDFKTPVVSMYFITWLTTFPRKEHLPYSTSSISDSRPDNVNVCSKKAKSN